MASSSAAVPLPVGLVKRDFAEDSAKDFAQDCNPAAGLPNKDQAVKWLCTTPGCPFLSRKDVDEFKGFCRKRCFEYFWKQNGNKRHGCKREQKLPGAGEKCQRFEYSGDPERPIFSWERCRPEWLPRVEEC